MALTKEDLQAIGELIDSKLAPMQAELSSLKEGQALLQEGQASLQEGQALLKTEMSEVKERIAKVQVIQETQVLPRIQLLAEGHSGLVDGVSRLEELPEQVEDIQNTVSVLKHVFKGHTHN